MEIQHHTLKGTELNLVPVALFSLCNGAARPEHLIYPHRCSRSSSSSSTSSTSSSSSSRGFLYSYQSNI